MRKLLLSFLTLASFALAILCGCGKTEEFTPHSYSSEGMTVESVQLEVSDRQIDVGISEDNFIHISYYDCQTEYFEISVSDGILKMELVTDKNWTDFIGTKADIAYRKIDIRIPDAILTDLKLTTTNEPINLSELSVKRDIFINSNGGNINFDKFNVGNSINLTAKNADITGSIEGGWDDFSIFCTIKKGESNLPEQKDGGQKSLNVDCNNGDVNINFIPGNN